MESSGIATDRFHSQQLLKQLQDVCGRVGELFKTLTDAQKSEGLEALQTTVAKVITNMKPSITGVKFILETESEEEVDFKAYISSLIDAEACTLEKDKDVSNQHTSGINNEETPASLEEQEVHDGTSLMQASVPEPDKPQNEQLADVSPTESKTIEFAKEKKERQLGSSPRSKKRQKSDTKYKCDVCNKTYMCYSNLVRHNRVHTGETPYKCDKCDMSYRDQSSLKLHQLKHTGEKPHECHICKKAFKTSSHLRRHEVSHIGERKYTCETCGKKFLHFGYLQQHKKVHTGHKPFECKQCRKKFSTKAALQHHAKGHAGIKEHKCRVCKKSFTTQRYLQEHQVLHTKERPYMCMVCQATFNQVSNLKRHFRVHSDDKPYICRFCHKQFKYSNSLQHHEYLHVKKKDSADNNPEDILKSSEEEDVPLSYLAKISNISIDQDGLTKKAIHVGSCRDTKRKVTKAKGKKMLATGKKSPANHFKVNRREVTNISNQGHTGKKTFDEYRNKKVEVSGSPEKPVKETGGIFEEESMSLQPINYEAFLEEIAHAAIGKQGENLDQIKSSCPKDFCQQGQENQMTSEACTSEIQGFMKEEEACNNVCTESDINKNISHDSPHPLDNQNVEQNKFSDDSSISNVPAELPKD